MKQNPIISKKTITLSIVLASSMSLSACTMNVADKDKIIPPMITPTPTIETMSEEQTLENEEGQAIAYRDGIYTVMGNYTSPAGEERIAVRITLKDGIITDSQVTGKAENIISIKKQSEFIEGYKNFVIGKNINEVKLDKVSGSSLTPKGFNAALEEIKKQAKSGQQMQDY